MHLLKKLFLAPLFALTIGAQSPNIQQIAQLKWYPASESATFPAGVSPQGLVFDGSSLWIANFFDSNLYKIRPSDGALLGKFTLPDAPVGLAFDGQNIWTTNRTANSVTKIRASDGAILAHLKGYNYPFAIAFDGVSIWVGNTGDNTVVKLNPATGAITNSFSLATGPIGMAFDGVSMWLGYTDGSVIKLTNNAVTAQLSVGFARALAFDGTNIWVTNYTSGYVFKINAAQASIAAVIPSGGNHPAGIAFDGNSVWVANQDGPVTQILPGGATRTHGSHQLCPSAVAFDGVNIWVSNSISNTVSKF